MSRGGIYGFEYVDVMPCPGIASGRAQVEARPAGAMQIAPLLVLGRIGATDKVSTFTQVSRASG